MHPFRSPRRSLRIALAALVGLAGCTPQVENDLLNPPPAPPSACTAIDTLVGCSAGAVAYACAGDRPDDGDIDLVCDDGVPGPIAGDSGGATTLYCCARYGQLASECVPATSVPGCGAESLGFSCTGEVSPDQVDPSIVCSGAVAGDAGAREYCCVPFDPAAGVCRCSTFDADAGACGTTGVGPCTSAGVGFDCAAGHSPSEIDPLLACEGASAGGDGGAAGDGGTGGASYCCRTP